MFVSDVTWTTSTTEEEEKEEEEEEGAAAAPVFTYQLSAFSPFISADAARSVLDPDRDAGGYKGNFDGIKVDRDGNLYAAGPGGLHVYAPDGTHLGLVATGAKTGNIALGRQFIYIAADSDLLRIRRA